MAGLLAVGMGLGDPFRAMPLFYPALALRALHSGAGGLIAVGLGYTACFVGAVALSGDLPLGGLLMPVAAQVAGLVIIAAQLSLLARLLARHERASDCEAVLSGASGALGTASTREAVGETAAEAALALARGHPQARASVVVESGKRLAVVAARGQRASEASGGWLDVEKLPERYRSSFQGGCALDLPDVEAIGPIGAFSFELVGRAVFATPLVVEDEPIGAVVLKSPRKLDAAARDSLSRLGEHVALALARLAADGRRREADERFRGLVQASPDVISLVAADGTISYQNPSAERLFGYGPGELIGASLADMVHPDDVGRFMAVLAEASDWPSVGPAVEARMCRRDGSWLHLETIATNTLDDANLSGMVLSSRDARETVSPQRAQPARETVSPRRAQRLKGIYRLRVLGALGGEKSL
ncbi:MAG TPA: PAS domain-containing protein, partial [Chloroflexota bacterium]|nr:PAS domain-containing protein [Chloroflexota bacterium]